MPGGWSWDERWSLECPVGSQWKQFILFPQIHNWNNDGMF